MTTPDFDLKEEMEELKRLAFPQVETDWRKGLAKHTWLLFGLVSALLVVSGALMGRVSNTDEREHAEFRQGIKDLQSLAATLDRRLDSQERRLSDYGDDSAKALKLMTELAQERYETYRAQAMARGDDAAVRRINRKIQALSNDSKSGGQP